MTVENEDSSETSLHMYQAKQLRIPEDSHPYHCGKNSPVSDDVTVMYRIWYRVLILPRNLNFTFPAHSMCEMKLTTVHLILTKQL